MQAIPIVMAVAGAGMKFLGSRKQASALEDAARMQEAAGEQAERIGMMNAAAQEAETAESVRRERVAAEEAQSLRRARAAAGGGTATGSTGAFLEEQAGREKQFIDWLQRSGASRAQIERERGRLAGQEGRATARLTETRAGAVRSQGWADLLGAGGNIYSMTT